MKKRTVLNELLEEFAIMEKKKTKILQEVEALMEKSAANPKEIVSLVRRIRKLIADFEAKLVAIEKMASKL